MRESDADPVSRSANWTRAWMLAGTLSLAATLIAALAGAFRTWGLPIGERLFLFGSVIGVNALKWGLWHAWVTPRIPLARWRWPISLALGTLILCLTLPLELELAYASLGHAVDLPFIQVYGSAVLVALAITLAMTGVRHLLDRPALSAPPPPQPERALPGFLSEAGVNAPGQLLGLEAEDHYVRLYLADGRRPLVLHAFGRAVSDLADFDGLQVHRGAWAARHAVAESFREGRKYRLRLTDGTVFPVSDRHLGTLRAKGWLERR